MENIEILGYTIKSFLGKGGMADVWYAENSLGKKAAIKIMHKRFAENDSVKSRFLKEAMAISLDLTEYNNNLSIGNIINWNFESDGPARG